MTTGTLSLTFETPDLNLTGTGEFDISETFKALITTHPQIQEEISLKVAEIFSKIKAKDVAEEWVKKIKKSFDIKDFEINIKSDIEKKAKEFIKTLSFGKLEIDPNTLFPKNTKKIQPIIPINNNFDNLAKYFTTDKNFQNFIKSFSSEKGFNSFFKNISSEIEKLNKGFSSFQKGFLSSLEKYTLNNIPPIIPTENRNDTVFNQSNEITINGFTDKALDQISSLFKGATKGTKKYRTSDDDVDVDKSNKGVFNKLMDKILAGTGLAGAASLLKGLTGPALLGGGILWAAIDGLRGWMKAEEWGVSKIAAALGGAIGGLSSGLDGALVNAGKGAIIGSGIGLMIGGPLGLVVGALIGTAVGGILGYIGGENLAKAFDAFGQWLNEHIIIELFGGMDNIKKQLSTIGLFFKNKVAPFLSGVFLDTLKWVENTMIPTLSNLFSAMKPLFEAIGWLTVNLIWPLFENVSKLLLMISKKGIEITFESLTFFLNWFTAIGQQIGNLSFMFYEKFIQIKDGFIRFGEAIGEGASIMVDWVSNTWKDIKTKLGNIWEKIKSPFQMIEDFISKNLNTPIQWIEEKWNATKIAIQDTFLKLFSWIGNLGTAIKDSILAILPERIRKWFESGEDPTVEKERPNPINNQIMGIPSQYRTPSIKTQAVIEQPKTIKFQPANEDKLYTMDQTSVFAKPDDILGKTFESINKQLSSLNTQIQKNTKILIEHTEIFQKILDVDQQQLNMLPALASTPETNDKQYPLSNIDSDRIYAYRNRIRENRIGRI